MNILGINGSVGWDGNLSMINGQDFWVHGSGATLFMDGELKGSVSEERLSRVKYDGNYPEQAIDELLTRNLLTPENIDIVAYVNNACVISYQLKLQGYSSKKLSSLFPNAKIMFVDHHLAHASGSFLTSGFMESNIFSFDGAGDFHPLSVIDPNAVASSGILDQGMRLNNTCFYNGNISTKNIEPIYQTYLDDTLNMFGAAYSEFSGIIYQLKVEGKLEKDEDLDTENNGKRLIKILSICSFGTEVDMTNYEYNFEDNMYMGPILRETHPGKIMGLAAYGDHTNVDIPDVFALTYEWNMPVIQYDENSKDFIINRAKELEFSPEDLAAWLQNQFETYLLKMLKHIPKDIKTNKLCLSGGCALNITANSKIIEEGIYEDVHVNTAPNDDGLNFGAAALCAFKNEKDLIIPENIGCIGLDYSDSDIITSIMNYNNKVNDAFLV